MRRHLDLLVLNLALAIVTGSLAAATYALHQNTLEPHPEWVSTKADLDRGVMGAVAFVNGNQALARNQLNLGAWFGYQEVLYLRTR